MIYDQIAAVVVRYTLETSRGLSDLSKKHTVMQVTRAWIEGFICKGRVNDPPKLRFHDLSGFV